MAIRKTKLVVMAGLLVVASLGVYLETRATTPISPKFFEFTRQHSTAAEPRRCDRGKPERRQTSNGARAGR